MSETWLTYSEAATAIGTSPEAIRQKSIREQWRRRRRQDGKTLVLIDLKSQKPRAPREQPVGRVNGRADDQGKIAALEGQIIVLKEALAEAKAASEHHRLEAAATRNRLDEIIAELMDVSRRMVEQAAEHNAYRRRPWWRRLVG
jgi:hypothetical protein